MYPGSLLDVTAGCEGTVVELCDGDGVELVDTTITAGRSTVDDCWAGPGGVCSATLVVFSAAAWAGLGRLCSVALVMGSAASTVFFGCFITAAHGVVDAVGGIQDSTRSPMFITPVSQ